MCHRCQQQLTEYNYDALAYYNGLASGKRNLYGYSLIDAQLKAAGHPGIWPERVEVTDDENLINSIAMGCPFDVNEKQALLQAKNLDERFEILISLMKMSMSMNSITGSGSALS